MGSVVFRIFGWWVFLAVLTLVCVVLLEPGNGGFWSVLVHQLELFWKWLVG